MNQTNPINQLHPTFTLTLVVILPILISCSDFVDQPEESDPSSPTVTEQPTPVITAGPSQSPTPIENPKLENDEQRNWKACEAERMWAFKARLIDANALRLFQQRNLAPVFNDPGVRQSGVEGWYACIQALELNGFDVAARE